jgi:anti-sigma-K factor RskA
VLDAVDAGPERKLASGRRVADAPRLAWSDLRVWVPLAALLVVAVGLGLQLARVQGHIGALEARLAMALKQAADAERATVEAHRVANQAQSAMAVLAAPDLARIDLAGQPAAPRASALALWSRQRGMVFTASNLPTLPAGRVYQVWVVTGSGPISAGLLEPDASGGGLRVFSTPPDIPAPVAVAVTLEPAGGVPAPTGEKVLIGTPAPSQ